MDYIQVDANKVPWVFWIQITWKKSNWFKSFWKSRQANSLEIILFKRICINIGRPWLQRNINYQLGEYGHLINIQNTNELNATNPWSFTVNPNR